MFPALKMSAKSMKGRLDHLLELTSLPPKLPLELSNSQHSKGRYCLSRSFNSEAKLL